MRICEIKNSAQYRMDEQNRNLPIYGIKLWFSKLKKKFQKFAKFYNFENHRSFIIDKLKKKKISEIVEFHKLANFQNLTICKTRLSLFQYSKFRIFKISAVLHLVVPKFDLHPK